MIGIGRVGNGRKAAAIAVIRAAILAAAYAVLTTGAYAQAPPPSIGFAPAAGPDFPRAPRAISPLAIPPLPSPPPAVPPAPLNSPRASTPVHTIPIVPAGRVALNLSARFGRDGVAINSGLIWRVYSTTPDTAGAYRPIMEDHTATPTFVLPPGSYVVHAGFGMSSAAKTVQLRSNTVNEVFDIAAGGLRLEGKVGDVRIPTAQISFDIYEGSQFEPGEKRPIVRNMTTGQIALVPEGTYYIVSNYGDGNSVVRSDIRVQAGKLTDVTVTHRAAVITLKLVDKAGGEALANTQWSVLTPGGDVIKESIGAFPRVILAEGEYRAIARNEGKTYEHEFKVINGVDREVEVMAR